MDQPFQESESYLFSSDENDAFDENLDLFDQQQFGDYEDGIGFSEPNDENELDEEFEDSEDQLYIDYDNPGQSISSEDLRELDDYDDLDD